MCWRRSVFCRQKPKTMNIRVEGTLAPGVTAKDLALAIIGKLGTGVGTGHVIEFSGSTIRTPLDGGAHDALQYGD